MYGEKMEGKTNIREALLLLNTLCRLSSGWINAWEWQYLAL